MLRLFIALPLPEDIRGRLAGICNGVPGARWVAPENMHLTLRFIGEVGHGEADDIDAALSTMRVPARSEEHTSEPQSLMRTPYAVFCLKKKKDTKTRRQEEHDKHHEITRQNQHTTV